MMKYSKWHLKEYITLINRGGAEAGEMVREGAGGGGSFGVSSIKIHPRF